jgi:hypothetical protein
MNQTEKKEMREALDQIKKLKENVVEIISGNVSERLYDLQEESPNSERINRLEDEESLFQSLENELEDLEESFQILIDGEY